MKMKHLLVIALPVFLMNISTAEAKALFGRVTFVGTDKEIMNGDNYSSRFRLRLSDSTCTGDEQKKERWVVVESGRMDGKFQHNMANFRNAYSTAMTAMLTGKSLQISHVDSCDTPQAQTLYLPKAQFGIH